MSVCDVAKGQTWVYRGRTYPDGAVRVLNVTDDGIVEFSPAGGGFVYRGPVDRFEAEFARRLDTADPPPWVEGRFALEDEGPWPGVWQRHRWNGWATPSFDKATVLAILASLDAPYREDGAVILVDMGDGEEQVLEPRTETIDGVARVLYAFDGWCFTEETD